MVLVAVGLFLVVASGAIFQTDLHIYDTARLMELALLAFALTTFIVSRPMASIATEALGARAGMVLLVMVVTAGLATIMAVRVHAAVDELAVNLALVLLGATLHAAIVRTGVGGWADTLLVFLFPLMAFSMLVRFAYELTAAYQLGETFQWVSPFLSFANVRFFSQIQAYSLWLATLPLAVAILSRRLRAFFFLVAAGYWMLLVLVPSRSVWLSLVLSAGCALAIFPRQAVMNWLRPALMALLAGVASAYVLMELLAVGAPGPREVMQHAGRIADRIELWTAATSLILAHPALGVGPANFPFFHASIFGHPHSALLQVAAEYGLPMAVILSLAVLWLLASGVRALRSTPDCSSGSAVFAALTCGLIDSMFSGNILMPHSQIVLVTLMAWLFARAGGWPHGGGLGNAAVLIARASACIVLGVLLWTAFGYYQFVNSGDYVLYSAGPRFWFDSRSVYYDP